MRRWMLAIVVIGGGVSLAASDPATQPATRPAAAPAPEARPALTPTYSTGRQSRRGGENRGRRSGESSESTSRPGDQFIASSGPMPQDFEILNYRNIFYKGHLPSPDNANRPAAAVIAPHTLETVLMFNGVTITDGKPTAFLENTDQGTVMQVHVGDAVAQGKIVAIALDSLEYQLNGQAQLTHVLIGQNLAGSNSWGTVAASQPSSTGSASADAMLEKLRQKRQAELNGK
jgi:hypothetical protein